MSELSATTPHHSVKRQLLQQVYEPGGTRCPTCTQHAQVYRRTINAGMARSLIQLYRLNLVEPGGWVHLPTALDARSREEGKLAYWGLIEERPTGRDDGGRAGHWRITGMGRAFVTGQLTMPRYALIYDGRLLGLDDTERISIRDCLRRTFNYDDLMNGRA